MVQPWRKRFATVSGSRCFRVVTALAAAVSLLALTSSPASAQTPKEWGDGSVRCSFSATIKFSPPLTELRGGTNLSRLKASLLDCTNSGFDFLGETVPSGSLSGYFAQSPFSCATHTVTGALLTGTARWAKGSFEGRVADFHPSAINNDIVSGSFAGTARVSLDLPSAMCAKGSVRSTRATGTVTLGPSCGPGSGPFTIYQIGNGPMCGGVYGPTSITAGPDGALWFTAPDAGSIGRISTSGNVTLYRLPGAYDFATSITAGPDGALWFTDQASLISNTSVTGGSIGRISTSGAVTIYPVSSGDPVGITPGPDGDLWFVTNVPYADPTGPSIDRITTAGTITSFALPGTVWPSSITAGPDGALWFTDFGHWYGDVQRGTSIGRITTSGVVTNYYTDPSLATPESITVGPDGALWFVNGSVDSSSIGRITTSGVITTYPVVNNFETGPVAIASGPDGALWFANYGPTPFASIGRITTSGLVTDYQDPNIDDPYDVTAGPDGGVWFVNYASDTIGRINPP
jgi:virginiamycin B lyase